MSLLRETEADAVLNAADPRFNPPILEAALEYGCTYLDMAMTLSGPGVMLGEEQLEADERWRERGLLALSGIGVEPGLADVFARYAADHLFDEIDEVGVRDGADLVVEGYDFAPTFSIWTTIEECLNPPLIWEKDRGFYTTEPFSEPELFEFPEGIGVIECVNVEHEEVVLVPREIDCRRVTFKYGLGTEFIDVLRTLHKLGLDSTEPVRVRGVEVAPRDVVAAALPDPATLGDRMRGKTCAGTLVTGKRKDGSDGAVYLYHVADNERTMREYGHQAVVLQTALNPVIALELLAAGPGKARACSGPSRSRPTRSSSSSPTTASRTAWSRATLAGRRGTESGEGREQPGRLVVAASAAVSSPPPPPPSPSPSSSVRSRVSVRTPLIVTPRASTCVPVASTGSVFPDRAANVSDAPPASIVICDASSSVTVPFASTSSRPGSRPGRSRRA